MQSKAINRGSRRLGRGIVAAASTAVILLAASPASAATQPVTDQVVQAGSSSTDYFGGVAPLADGDVIVSGRSDGAGEYGGIELPADDGTYSSVLARLDADGSAVWAKVASAGPSMLDAGRRVVLSADGQSVVQIGEYAYGDTTVAPGDPNARHLTNDVCAAEDGDIGAGGDGYVAAFSVADGHLLWAAKIGGNSDASVDGLTVLPDGSSVVTGNYEGCTEITFETADPEAPLTLANEPDADGEIVNPSNGFVAKFDPNGRAVWATAVGGGGNAYVHDVALLGNGTLAVTGEFDATATFETAAGAISQPSYNADLTPYWARMDAATGKFTSVGTPAGNGFGIAVAPGDTTDSLVFTGAFAGDMTFDSGRPRGIRLSAGSQGDADIFLARVAASNKATWAKSAGSVGSNDIPYDLARFPTGQYAIAGDFGDTAVFGAGEPTSTALHATDCNADSCWREAFVAKYNANGTLVWAQKGGGTGADGANAVAAAVDNSVLVAGAFEGAAGNVTFGTDAAGAAVTQPGMGGVLDAFVWRLH